MHTPCTYQVGAMLRSCEAFGVTSAILVHAERGEGEAEAGPRLVCPRRLEPRSSRQGPRQVCYSLADRRQVCYSHA